MLMIQCAKCLIVGLFNQSTDKMVRRSNDAYGLAVSFMALIARISSSSFEKAECLNRTFLKMFLRKILLSRSKQAMTLNTRETVRDSCNI